MQSTLHIAEADRGMHVAIIMDGNGRWATLRGLPRVAGHREGATPSAAWWRPRRRLGIGTLTLYAFSSDNWGRPPREVERAHAPVPRATWPRRRRGCVENGVRLRVIGRRDRLRARAGAAIAGGRGGDGGRADAAPAHRRRLLAPATPSCAPPPWPPGSEAARATGSPKLLARAMGDDEPAPDVDLLIRTGGEQRLSDFLLWECAYAELVFTPRMWPDFGAAPLAEAVDWFHRRDRRYGLVKSA